MVTKALFVADLQRTVSTPRLDAYRLPNGTDWDMALNYFWNVALSEALYPGLCMLEVTLRNAIHRDLSRREGTELWFRGLLEPRQLRDFAGTSVSLHDKLKRQPTPGQIVAELNFGFWTTLLSQPYNQSLWTPNKSALLRAVFSRPPRVPNNRHYIHGRYNDLRLLRNRVMHHEPIWNGLTYKQTGQSDRHVDIYDLHNQILEAIGWVSDTARRSVQQIDTFDTVYQQGRAQIEADLKAEFNIP
ncbi:MAG: hypothetical protein ACRDJH_12480 [Thermomicrobiales bacterium]